MRYIEGEGYVIKFFPYKFNLIKILMFWSKKKALERDKELSGMFGDNTIPNINYHIELNILLWLVVIEI